MRESLEKMKNDAKNAYVDQMFARATKLLSAIESGVPANPVELQGWLQATRSRITLTGCPN